MRRTWVIIYVHARQNTHLLKGGIRPRTYTLIIFVINHVSATSLLGFFVKPQNDLQFCSEPKRVPIKCNFHRNLTGFFTSFLRLVPFKLPYKLIYLLLLLQIVGVLKHYTQ